MNILSPNYNINTHNVMLSQKNESRINFTSLKPLKNDTIEFAKKVITKKDYEKAQKYANRMSKIPAFMFQNKSLQNMNLNKMEGIQYGIPVFDGMSIKEVAFAVDSIHSVATLRGCENACRHCYADAKPNKMYEKTEGLTNRMDFEDFKGLTDGIAELRQRLGKIDINTQKRKSDRPDDIYTSASLFHDSDCINIQLKDKNGEVHSFPELNKMLVESTGQGGFFDTAGWNIHDKEAQERAREIASYYMNSEHDSELAQFNISINTFNPWTVKAAQLRKEGNIESADRINEKYIERMANTILTFSGLLDKPYFGIIPRALPNGTKNAEGLCENDLRKILGQIYEKIVKNYKSRIQNNEELEKSPEVMKYFQDTMASASKKLSAPIETTLISSGRLAKYADKYSITLEKDSVQQKMLNDFKTSPNKKNANNMFKIIDTNGDLYLTDYVVDIPTDIHFNFKNKNLKTPPMGNLDNDMMFSKEML